MATFAWSGADCCRLLLREGAGRQTQGKAESEQALHG